MICNYPLAQDAAASPHKPRVQRSPETETRTPTKTKTKSKAKRVQEFIGELKRKDCAMTKHKIKDHLICIFVVIDSRAKGSDPLMPSSSSSSS